MKHLALLLMILLSISTTGLADGSLAHFHDALGRHGVFRKDDADLVLYLEQGNLKDPALRTEESLVLTKEQLLQMVEDLKDLRPAVMNSSEQFPLTISGSSNGTGATLTLAVDRKSFGNLCHAVNDVRRFLRDFN